MKGYVTTRNLTNFRRNPFARRLNRFRLYGFAFTSTWPGGETTTFNLFAPLGVLYLRAPASGLVYRRRVSQSSLPGSLPATDAVKTQLFCWPHRERRPVRQPLILHNRILPRPAAPLDLPFETCVRLACRISRTNRYPLGLDKERSQSHPCLPILLRVLR